jgi:predicted nucleotidyltransferase
VLLRVEKRYNIQDIKRAMRAEKEHQVSEVIREVRRDGQVLALILFGSRVREEHTAVSDVDLCLVLGPAPYTSLELSRKKLEYLTKFSADIHIFQQLPLYMKQRVLRDGKVLFCRDEDSLYELAFTVIREYSDFEHVYRDYLREVTDAG